MPLLNDVQVVELLDRARRDHKHTLDYCRTCDEFYWLDIEGDCAEHDGHRKTIVPFVEDRWLRR